MHHEHGGSECNKASREGANAQRLKCSSNMGGPGAPSEQAEPLQASGHGALELTSLASRTLRLKSVVADCQSSTKNPEYQEGLGLALVRDIVRNWVLWRNETGAMPSLPCQNK